MEFHSVTMSRIYIPEHDQKKFYLSFYEKRSNLPFRMLVEENLNGDWQPVNIFHDFSVVVSCPFCKNDMHVCLSLNLDINEIFDVLRNDKAIRLLIVTS